MLLLLQTRAAHRLRITIDVIVSSTTCPVTQENAGLMKLFPMLLANACQCEIDKRVPHARKSQLHSLFQRGNAFVIGGYSMFRVFLLTKVTIIASNDKTRRSYRRPRAPGFLPQRPPLESPTPLRIGQTQDIATAAVFLAFSDSAWITGETLYITSGLR